MIKKISDCRNDFLSVIYEKIAALNTHEELVKRCLPERLAAHCQIAHASDDTITIHTKNASILSQLHHCKSELLQKLRTEEKMYGLKTIHFKLEAPQFRSFKKVSPEDKSIQSEKASSECCDSSEKNTDSASVEEALERLGKTLKKKE